MCLPKSIQRLYSCFVKKEKNNSSYYLLPSENNDEKDDHEDIIDMFEGLNKKREKTE